MGKIYLYMFTPSSHHYFTIQSNWAARSCTTTEGSLLIPTSVPLSASVSIGGSFSTESDVATFNTFTLRYCLVMSHHRCLSDRVYLTRGSGCISLALLRREEAKMADLASAFFSALEIVIIFNNGSLGEGKDDVSMLAI